MRQLAHFKTTSWNSPKRSASFARPRDSNPKLHWQSGDMRSRRYCMSSLPNQKINSVQSLKQSAALSSPTQPAERGEVGEAWSSHHATQTLSYIPNCSCLFNISRLKTWLRGASGDGSIQLRTSTASLVASPLGMLSGLCYSDLNILKRFTARPCACCGLGRSCASGRT